MLNHTYEHPRGRDIHAALILVSYDVPATRKICEYVSALVSCHRCEKKVNYENRQHNFAEMKNFDKWFFSQDPNVYCQNAIRWRHCNSDAS